MTAPAARASELAWAGPDWRRWRVPLALIALIVAGGVAIALVGRLTAPKVTNPYLDPAGSSFIGSHALADVLRERGSQVVRAYSASGALAAVGQAGRRPPVTLLITSPFLLPRRQLVALGRAGTDLFLVGPGRAALAALAPGVRLARGVPHEGQLLQPRCRLAAARLAGSANVGGFAYRAPAGAVGCYPRRGHPSLVRLTLAGRTVTIVGGGAALTNGQLAANGNAALVVGLLGSGRRIVWLTPQPSGHAHVPPPGGPRPGASAAAPSLIPWPAWLVVIELAVAVVLAALWRARRLGPLITERLPVVVRASETVEGHAGLYRSLRARDRASAALRQAMVSRVRDALGLGRDAPDDTVAGALADRSGRTRQEITALVFGPPPATDAELVRLARSLDELERQVREQ